jgi:hypothetical protein
MLLGTLLKKLEAPDYSATLLEGLGDIILLARIEETGRNHDETPAEYASMAVARFSQSASDEDWLGVMNALERSPEPATACLRRMVEWALDKDVETASESSGTCTCGGQGGCHADG